MKLRIKGNSIRIRLTKSEIENFGREGYLEDQTDFGNSSLVYALYNDPSGAQLAAEMTGSKITISVPAGIAGDWVSTEKVGFQNSMPLGNGGELFILIEKDFKCIDNAIEDQSDNYENPSAACG